MAASLTVERRRAGVPVAWMVGILAALIVVSMATLSTSRAAFFAKTENAGSSFEAGRVTLTDDDADSVMFNLTGMKPGTTAERCINVTYAGLPAQVRLYGSVGGDGLAQYLSTTIEEGAGAAGGAALDCTGFAANSTLHNTSLDAFAPYTNFGNGLVGFGTSGANSVSGGTRSYRVVVTLQDNNDAQGKSATATFTWEAQNV